MVSVTLCALVFLVGPCLCEHYLQHLSYLRLPATISPQNTYKMFSGTAENAAYDHQNQILYVVGGTSRLLHMIDISDPFNPTLVHNHQFSSSDGIPLDVAVCGTEVAVALASPIKDVYEGHVYFFKTFIPGSSFEYASKITVGSHPHMLTYDGSCAELLVANSGRPGKDASNVFLDPEGTVITISRSSAGNAVERFTDFNAFNTRTDIRLVSENVPRTTWPIKDKVPTVASDVEPQYIAVTPDNKEAYVVLQKNSAIARMSIRTGQLTNIYSLPSKDWTDKVMDPSDLDGGIHLRQFPFKSTLQPSVAKVIGVGSSQYLITANEGMTTSFTNSLHGFTWSDNGRASTLKSGSKFDPLYIQNDTFYEYLGTNSKAGRTTVSSIDGYDLRLAKITVPHHFGGRGFSIFKTNNFGQPVYDSGDTMEKAVAMFMPNVFNGDCTSNTITTKSPENEKDSSSDDMGLKLNAMDVVTDNGVTYMLLGSETVGALFLYTIKTDNTTSGHPEPTMESVYRAGLTDFVWSELYQMEQAGDAGISNIGFIPSSKHQQNKTFAYVIGSRSGSVSLYEIKQR